MTEEQFLALELWVKAEVEARLQMRNCGPQVNEAFRTLATRRAQAKAVMVTHDRN